MRTALTLVAALLLIGAGCSNQSPANLTADSVPISQNKIDAKKPDKAKVGVRVIEDSGTAKTQP